MLIKFDQLKILSIVKPTSTFPYLSLACHRDYNLEQNEDTMLARMFDHKEAIVSLLNWASLFLGLQIPCAFMFIMMSCLLLFF